MPNVMGELTTDEKRARSAALSHARDRERLERYENTLREIAHMDGKFSRAVRAAQEALDRR